MNPPVIDTESGSITSTVPAVCSACGQRFDAFTVSNPITGRPWITARACPPCVEREQEKQRVTAEETVRGRAQAARRAAWEAICPLDYRTPDEGGPTDPVRLALEQPKLEKVLAHPLGARGLILRGPTGARKTRCAYRLLRAYFDRRPVNPRILAMTAGEFDRQARDAAGDFTLTAWFRRLAGVDVLFLDDLGKGAWTRATAGQFWELVDDRARNGRPLIATTNYVGDALVKALNLDGDTGPALLRRLRDHCDGIVMQAKETTK